MFGISMDYLCFAMTRVQELYRYGWSTKDAIIEGVGNSFGVVGSAAAIMIAVAAVFAVQIRFFAMQQMGFALAVAVLLDTTIILLVLLPALMGLAGRRLYYLPSWLQWIPGGRETTPAPEPIATSALGPASTPVEEADIPTGTAEGVRCPRCGSETVVRTAKKGPRAGSKFYVCTRYPACKGKVPLSE
jgi:RND superfamily putative drug exporter